MTEDRNMNLTSEQRFIKARFAKCAGSIMDYLESALPVEAQYKAVRKLILERLYQTQDEILVALGKGEAK